MKTKHLILAPMAALVSLLCTPAAGIAQSILGSAGNFTLLGGGSVTSVGSPAIGGGDVGYGVGITGINPGDVSGGMIIGPGGPVVNQGLLDLGKAATGLSAMTANMILSGQDLGGKTLLPGVYKFAVAAQLNGDLTLDANGQTNAYWVFQIGTSLTTTANSMVTVINAPDGGSSDGIFWDAQASITFGSGNAVLGNYLAGVSLTYGGTVSGANGARALAQADLTLAGNAVNAHGGAGGSDWTGGLKFNGVGAVVPVPEPAAVLWLMPLGAVGLVVWRRRIGAAKLAA